MTMRLIAGLFTSAVLGACSSQIVVVPATSEGASTAVVVFMVPRKLP